MSLTFNAVDDGHGMEVFDSVERHRYALETNRAVAPTTVSSRKVDAPIDSAVQIKAEKITLPDVAVVYVRDKNRETVAEAEHFADIHLEQDRYTIELTTPIKTYLQVESSVEIQSDAESTTITFDENTCVRVGARSRHEKPEYTITTTEDPQDMMKAVSALSAALKETTPERSYPTMRGHPALIELGEDLDIPQSMPVPDTGIQIEIPPDTGSIFVAAPLAFYLGADLVEGEEPQIVGDGFEYDLAGGQDFSTTVERTLKQIFFLDCCVRTEGLYKVDLHEREAIDDELPEDPENLYNAGISEQLEKYLSIPYDRLESYMPDWKLTTHISPDADSVELLPFLLDDLAIIRLPEERETGEAAAQEAAIEEFVRDSEFTRSASATPEQQVGTVQPGETDSLEQAWVGEGAPLGASKPTAEAFYNRLNRQRADGDIDITVICNDPNMAEERDLVGSTYGDREGLPFDVSVHHNLGVEELRIALEASADFLHYIGHIDEDGFKCSDGKLDARELEEVGVDAFFLNACQSYEQGMALIETGSIGGVVTLREVINSGAVAVGSTLARLLNRGFPLRSGLEIARDESVMGTQYMVVGDGGLGLTQTESGSALLTEVTELDEDFGFTIHSYPTESKGMGSMVFPYIDGVDQHYLGGGELDEFEVSKEELVGLLSMEDFPVIVDGELSWSSEAVAQFL